MSTCYWEAAIRTCCGPWRRGPPARSSRRQDARLWGGRRWEWLVEGSRIQESGRRRVSSRRHRKRGIIAGGTYRKRDINVTSATRNNRTTCCTGWWRRCGRWRTWATQRPFRPQRSTCWSSCVPRGNVEMGGTNYPAPGNLPILAQGNITLRLCSDSRAWNAAQCSRSLG